MFNTTLVNGIASASWKKTKPKASQLVFLSLIYTQNRAPMAK